MHRNQFTSLPEPGIKLPRGGNRVLLVCGLRDGDLSCSQGFSPVEPVAIGEKEIHGRRGNFHVLVLSL